VLVAIKNELRSSRRLEGQQSEHLMIELYPANCSKFLLGVFYRPPNSEEGLLIELRDSLERLDESCQFVLVGDFNLPNIDWSLDFPFPTSEGSHKEELFCDLITDQFLYQKAVGQTYLHGNKLDCVFVNSPELITNVSCTNATDMFPTDHYLIEFNSISSFVFKKQRR
jgi:endonuclease/exonuclease/phosphatase family metal-dependent hydrolase